MVTRAPALDQRDGDRGAEAGAAAGHESMIVVEHRHRQIFVAIVSPRSASRQSWSRPGQ